MKRGGLQSGLTVAAVMVLASGLAACGQKTREAIGIDRAPPDEFAVLTRAPLAIPPGFGLRPPRPGTPRPQEREVKDEARNVLFRRANTDRASDGASPSSGEQALLGHAGARNAKASIRSEVDNESDQIADAGRGFVDKLVFWRATEAPGEVIDATAESQRLRSNAALGSPPTTGVTPVIKRRETGLLEGIFK